MHSQRGGVRVFKTADAAIKAMHECSYAGSVVVVMKPEGGQLMDAQQQLFGLMAVAEEHQKAVKAAIDGLTAERAALAKERAAVAQAAASVAGIAGEVRKAAADAVPAMQKAAGEAVGASVRQSLAGASDAAAKALGEAAKPVIGSLSGVVQAASDAEGSMRNAGAWFAWKWVAVAAGGLVGVCLVAYASLAWQLHQVSSLREKRPRSWAMSPSCRPTSQHWRRRADASP